MIFHLCVVGMYLNFVNLSDYCICFDHETHDCLLTGAGADTSNTSILRVSAVVRAQPIALAPDQHLFIPSALYIVQPDAPSSLTEESSGDSSGTCIQQTRVI